jgi:NitT/TauT family transport system permease protein
MHGDVVTKSAASNKRNGAATTRKSFEVKYTLISILTLALFVLVWQLVVDFEIVSTKVLASPIEVGRAFVEKLTNKEPDGSTLGQNVLTSLELAMTGLVAGSALGVPLGLLMGWYKPVDRFVRPVFDLLRPIPPVGWIPISLLLLGFGFRAKAMIIFVGTFIPSVINSDAGIRLTPQSLIDVAKTCGARDFEIFLKVGIPYSLPMVVTGLRIALANSWAALVAAEMLAANSGLGNMIVMGRQFVRTDLIILGMIIIGGIGILLVGLFERLEKRILKGRI